MLLDVGAAESTSLTAAMLCHGMFAEVPCSSVQLVVPVDDACSAN